jgi:hypothetical protein
MISRYSVVTFGAPAATFVATPILYHGTALLAAATPILNASGKLTDAGAESRRGSTWARDKLKGGRLVPADADRELRRPVWELDGGRARSIWVLVGEEGVRNCATFSCIKPKPAL